MDPPSELSPGLDHIPRWLTAVIIAVMLACAALSWIPIGRGRLESAVPDFIPIVAGLLVVACWLAIVVTYLGAIRGHRHRHEPLYAALDAWKLLYAAAAFYWFEGQLFPMLPATGLAFAFYAVAFIFTLLGVPTIFSWYGRRLERRATR